MQKFDVVIIGAGASGLMCAIEAAKRGRKIVILDHANKIAKKILMSGGGRCNFSNYNISPEHYISHNPHFCKSALSRYTQWDFLELINKYQIDFEERSHGQLFCNNSAKDIVKMLVSEVETYNGKIKLQTSIDKINVVSDNHFIIESNQDIYHSKSLVIATGGLSIPTIGASPYGYKIAEQFGHKIYSTKAGLVPFTLHIEDKQKLATLSGIAVNSIVSNDKISFRENILFTHRGLSGPAILQTSSYWHPGDTITINLLPDTDLVLTFNQQLQNSPQIKLKNVLSKFLPKRLVSVFLHRDLSEKTLQQIGIKKLKTIAEIFQNWQIKPNGTEGYRTAEITLGGVDCNQLSSKNMESKLQKGLYFIGEVIDVTGWLGGYNFQWAWSSGWCCGQVV